MENAGYIGLSYQMALHRQMAVIANNIANANSTAFKAERPLFETVPVRQQGQLYEFVQDNGIVRSLNTGRLRETGNPMDVAISGKGFFAVETPAGTRYTRNGSLRLSEDGRLVTADGHSVLDERGQPITLDPADGKPVIAEDGTVSTAQGAVGRLRVMQFENEQRMRKVSTALYASEDEPKPAPAVQIRQGMIEDSNVEPVLEMTEMIEVARSYQAAQRLIETEHERERKAIERLARAA
jgi:flagellar basal-body rod protein FlgF